MIDPFTVPHSNEYMLDGLDLEVTLLYQNTFEKKMTTLKPVTETRWWCLPYEEEE